MLTILWNPRGLHLNNVLENIGKFNAMHYVTEILSPLSEWGGSDALESDYKLIIHVDVPGRTLHDFQLNSLGIIG
jgi:hypothetical protein